MQAKKIPNMIKNMYICINYSKIKPVIYRKYQKNSSVLSIYDRFAKSNIKFSFILPDCTGHCKNLDRRYLHNHRPESP